MGREEKERGVVEFRENNDKEIERREEVTLLPRIKII